MTILNDILEKVRRKEKLHMVLIDPKDQSSERAGEIAKIAEEAGTYAIMVGGSTGITPENVYETVKEIKKKSKLPVIIFPNSPKAIAPNADAIYFMSLLNSKKVKFIIGQQTKGAPIIKKYRETHNTLEPISMAYLIVKPGMKAGKKGKARLIKRHDAKAAVNYSLCAQYLGMSLVYLEAGSGAKEHVPLEMITKVRENIQIPLIVGGGIKTPEIAKAVTRAGADIIVIGDKIEKSVDITNVIRSFVHAIKNNNFD